MNTQVIIQYLADLRSIKRQTKELERLNKVTAQKFGKDFSRATSIVSRGLDSISRRKINVDGKTATETVSKFSTVVRTAEGGLRTFTTTTTKVNGAVKGTTETFKEGGKEARGFGANIKTLISRAALTIPVWFALRAAIGAVTSTIRDGVGGIISFDRSLQRLKKNLQGTSSEIEKNFNNAKEVITEFSILTGKSTDEIANAIQRFATVGFSYEESLKAGIDATKLSISLFGDAEGTANAFARALNVLVDRSDELVPVTQQISEAFALTSALYEQNAFELDELRNGLEKFSGTAKSLNFTTEETITLLAALSTQGLNANRAGNLLRTSFLKLEGNLDSLARTLGVKVNPEVDRTFDVFRKVINAIGELRSESGTISPALTEAIGDLFGGTRGGEPILDIVSDLEKVNATLDEFTGTRADVGKFNEDFEDINEETFQLAERMKNLKTEIGKAFITGLVGADNFNGLLKNIVNAQETLNNSMERFGAITKNALITIGVASLIGFRAQLLKLLLLLANPLVAGAAGLFAVLNFKEEANRLEKEARSVNEKFNKLGQDIADQINKGFKGKLSVKELEDLINRIEVFGGKQLGFDQFTLDRASEVLTDILEKEKNISKEKTKQANLVQKGVEFEKDRVELAEAVLASELEILKSQGARNSQLLQVEKSRRKQFDIQKQDIDQIKDKLKLEREINEERRLQNELSSESVKLFRIAQTQGVDVARRIGDVLSGDIDFDQFVRRGGQAVDIFKRQFGDIFEQQQAVSFFRGDRVPGASGLRGGSNIPIQEQALLRGTQAFNPRAEAQLQQAVQQTQAPIRQTNNVNITNNITTSNPEEIKRIIEKTVVDGFENSNSTIGRSARNVLDEF